MDTTLIESRRNKILECIIETHIQTASPVGSHEVCRRYHLQLSPATVRNVMGELEGETLVTHPHTSAGRVPTNRGYRFFVDSLMAPQRLSEAELRSIDALAREPQDGPVELLRSAAHVAAVLSGQAGIALAPRLTQSALRRIELIPVDTHRVLGIIVTAEGLLKHSVLEFQEVVDSQELARLSRFLSEELDGETLGGVHEHLQHALMDASNAFNYLYRRAQEFLELGGFLAHDVDLIIERVSHLLDQPEFRHAEQGRPLLAALEAGTSFLAALEQTIQHGRLRLVIGTENAGSGLSLCSIVSIPYRAGARLAGAIGVVGPARMDYGRVVSIVDRVADVVSRGMSRFIV